MANKKKSKSTNIASLLSPDQNTTNSLNQVFNLSEEKTKGPELPPIAKLNMGSDDLAEEIAFLINPKNQKNKWFEIRKANLYAYAFLNENSDLVKFLENRFSSVIEIPDKEINIIIK